VPRHSLNAARVQDALGLDREHESPEGLSAALARQVRPAGILAFFS
jgi:hypothetical protein